MTVKYALYIECLKRREERGRGQKGKGREKKNEKHRGKLNRHEPSLATHFNEGRWQTITWTTLKYNRTHSLS